LRFASPKLVDVASFMQPIEDFLIVSHCVIGERIDP